jgi:hypothetical protein
MYPLISNTTRDVKIEEGASICFYRKIHANRAYHVTKFGRTTSWTTGKVSTIASFLRLRNDEDSVVPIALRDRPNDVVLAFGILSNSKGKDFLEGGDSSSAVLLNERGIKATAIGLGFSGNLATRVCYMCPLSLVIRDIEHVTGAKVVEPVEAEQAEGMSL